MMNYKKIYEDLCSTRSWRSKEKELGYEVHHIKPRSFGGMDTEDNLVKFTYREHLLAHILLHKFSRGKNKVKMGYALRFMLARHSNGNKTRYYENARMCARYSIKSQGELGFRVDMQKIRKSTSYNSSVKKLDKELLKSLGYTPSKLNGTVHAKILKICINVLMFASDNGYYGVNGLLSDTEGLIIKNLFKRGLVDKLKCGRGMFVSLTDKGYKLFSSPSLDRYRGDLCFSNMIANNLDQVKKWNKVNPKKLIVVVRDKFRMYHIERYSYWDKDEFDLKFKDFKYTQEYDVLLNKLLTLKF